MVEKFSDYEGGGFLNQVGNFKFEVLDYELKDSAKGNAMAVFNVKSDAGTTTLYHVLSPKARWSYNNLIKACLRLVTKEQILSFQCDYETIGNDLLGKEFMGEVVCEKYEKEIKKPNDDGTFETAVEIKDSYKIKSYSAVV